MLDALWQDVRFAVRSIRRSPGVAGVIVITMALAIGANAALFSVFNAIVLKALPVRDASRLVVLNATDDRGNANQFIYAATVERLRDGQQAFDRLLMYSGGGLLRAEARGTFVDGIVEGVEPEYFDTLGVRAVLGRTLTAADTLGPDGSPVVVLSHRFWTRHYAADPRAIGESLTIEGAAFTIVGVAEPGFYGLQAVNGADFFLPIAALRPIAGDPTRPLRAINVIGRLRDAVTLDEARAQVRARWPAILSGDIPGLPAVDRAAISSQQITLESIATGFSTLRRQYADPIVVLSGLTVLLLAIGCANLSGLQLARAVSRDRQTALRRVLGASSFRLVQLSLVEAITLSAAGTSAGVVLAWWVSRLLEAALTTGPLAIAMTPDARVLATAAAVSVVAGASIALLPAWRATWTRGIATLDTARIKSSNPAAGRVLLVGQIALSLVLVFAAGLFARSLARLRAVDVGADPSRLVWARLWMNPGQRRTAFGTAYWTALADRFKQMPGVESVAFSYVFPATARATPPPDRFTALDRAASRDQIEGSSEAISPGFFRTTAIPLLQGRDVTWNDDARAPNVGIVSASLARKLYGDGNAVGRRIRLERDGGRVVEIIGVAADAAVGNLRNPNPAVLFRPMLQEPSRQRVPNALVRGRGDVTPILTAFPQVAASGGGHFVRNVLRQDRWIEDALLRERLVAWLSAFFAALAALLSCLGVYGLLAYAVARRTREIGVRMALGATAWTVLRSVALEGLALGTIGVAMGLPLALVASRFARSLLYGLAPNDALTLAAASAGFIVLATIAGLIPASRAASIDPMSALRRD